MSAIVLNPACVKTLSAVEAEPPRSNQHEFNGVSQLKQIFGTVGFTRSATFSIRGTSQVAHADVTWYDARAAHPVRSEFRLYFQTNAVMDQARAGDNIVVGLAGQTLHVILIKTGAQGHNPSAHAWAPTPAGGI